ncbi:MAG: hypothetical protein GX444_02040 [Myxococcales bacterium]|nr:hypothetical protein [Myxococcales bacterium]
MKLRYWLIALAVAGLALAFAACRESNDDETTPAVEGTPPDACADNTAPSLDKAIFFVDGEASGASATFMESASVDIYLTFSDGECNLGGGRIEYAVDGGEADKQSIGTDAPCAAAAADQVLGFTFSGMGEGEHSLAITLVDRCGAGSAAATLTYTLTAYEPPADDDSGDDDDDTAAPMELAGEIRYYGETTDYTGRPVTLGLYTDWLPGEELPVAYVSYTVPETGFPFAYEWNLDDAAVAPGDYYVFGYLDAVDGDGVFVETVDPAAAPYYAVTVAAGLTTTWHVNLVAPQK